MLTEWVVIQVSVQWSGHRGKSREIC